MTSPIANHPQPATNEDVRKLEAVFGNDLFYKALLIASIFFGLLPFLIVYPLYLNNEFKKQASVLTLVKTIQDPAAGDQVKRLAARVLALNLSAPILSPHIAKEDIKMILFPPSLSDLERGENAKRILQTCAARPNSAIYKIALEVLLRDITRSTRLQIGNDLITEASCIEMRDLGSQLISIAQTVDLSKEAPKYVLPDVDSAILQQVLQKKISEKSIHEWMTSYIDPNERALLQAGFNDPELQFLCRSHPYVITYSALPNWVIKGGPKFNVAQRTHTNLLRVIYAEDLRALVDREKLDLIYVPKEGFVKSGVDQGEIHEQYYVFSEKLDILSSDETMKKIDEMHPATKTKLKEQLCRFLSLSGYEDFSFDNFRLLRNSDQLVVIDTEPLDGPLYSKDDNGPKRPFNPKAGLEKLRQQIEFDSGQPHPHFSKETRDIFLGSY